jgi:hypothetical protein
MTLLDLDFDLDSVLLGEESIERETAGRVSKRSIESLQKIVFKFFIEFYLFSEANLLI